MNGGSHICGHPNYLEGTWRLQGNSDFRNRTRNVVATCEPISAQDPRHSPNTRKLNPQTLSRIPGNLKNQEQSTGPPLNPDMHTLRKKVIMVIITMMVMIVAIIIILIMTIIGIIIVILTMYYGDSNNNTNDHNRDNSNTK